MGLEALKREQDAFDRKLDDLLRDHAGEFVVLHNGSLAGFYTDYAADYQGALKQFGLDEAFLVSEVKKRDPEPVSLSWQTGVMFSRG